MARPRKDSEGPSKADQIRDELKSNPRAKPSAIVKILGERGVKVLANHVYAIKAHMKSKKYKQRRDAAGAAAQEAGLANPVQAVVEVRKLAARLGGMSHLKKLVDLLVA